MAAVRSAVNFHVHPGRYADLFEALKTVKKIVERAGGTFTVNRQAIGPQPGNVVALSQYADWGALAKVRSDPEFVQFLETIRNNPNPAADIVASSVFDEVVL
jgi:hypothetical protein